MKSLYVVVLLACLSQALGFQNDVFEFGKDVGEVAFEKTEYVHPFQTHSEMKVDVRPEEKVTYVRVTVHNFLSTPKVDYDFDKNTVYVDYKLTLSQASFYKVLAKTVPRRHPNNNGPRNNRRPRS